MRYSNPQADCRRCLQFKRVMAIQAKFVTHKKAQLVRGFGKQSLNHQWIDIERKTNQTKTNIVEIISSVKEKLIFDPTILVQTKKESCGRASNTLPPNFSIITCLL